jgi:predicted RNA-binding Zn ribbon-like protein
MALRPRRTIEDLITVANTIHGRDGHFPLTSDEPLAPGETHDHLESATTTVDFLRTNGVALPPGSPGRQHLTQLRRLREAVRALAAGDRRAYARRTPVALSKLRFHIVDDEIVAAQRGWDGFVADLTLTLSSARDLAGRLKTCANPDCRWLYADGSKNRSRRWCERQTCGNRANVRRWRKRSRARRPT